MEDYVGIACGRCDGFTPMGGPRCVQCGNELLFHPRAEPVSQAPAPKSPEPEPSAAPAADSPSQEELMEQARNYVCKECMSPVPSGHKFCGACGATVPEEIQELQTEFFGAMQTPGKARLILIRGDQGVDGLSYLLQGNEHIAGRAEGQILFPEDQWVSPKHANFLYRGDKLVVRDEGSVNGVYVRIKDSVPLEPGDHFLCGEQIFRLEQMPADTSGPADDGTHFYSSPKAPSSFRVVQIVTGGAPGMVFCAGDEGASIGREDCDMNFPEDIYISGSHAKVEQTGGSYALKDNGSKNGTYVRIKGEHELGHGDYLFVGHQLLRVEMTA